MVIRITVLCLTLPAFVWAAQLSSEIQADRYLLRADRQIKGRDFTGAKESLDRLGELQTQHGVEIPEDFSLKYAQVSLGLGLYAEAIESATRYLTLSGRDGEHYRAALELLDKAEAEMAAVEAARKRAEEKRKRLRDAIVGIESVRIPAGEFLMGSRMKPGEVVLRAEPVTRMHISRAFDMGKYEVTQEQWEAIMGSNPSHHAGCMDCPVEEVSWEDVQNFIRRLNRLSKTHSDGAEYRLPTEAEWEICSAPRELRGIRMRGMCLEFWGAKKPDTGTDLMVSREQWEANAPGRAEGTEPLGSLRHAGERVRVGAGLVRRVSGRVRDGPRGGSQER